MKGNKKTEEETVPLSLKGESPLKARTRARFQQLIKTSNVDTSLSKLSTSTDKVEETPLLYSPGHDYIKAEIKVKSKDNTGWVGSSNLGFVTEDKETSDSEEHRTGPLPAPRRIPKLKSKLDETASLRSYHDSTELPPVPKRRSKDTSEPKEHFSEERQNVESTVLNVPTNGSEEEKEQTLEVKVSVHSTSDISHGSATTTKLPVQHSESSESISVKKEKPKVQKKHKGKSDKINEQHKEDSLERSKRSKNTKKKKSEEIIEQDKTEASNRENCISDDGQIFGIIIHNTDRLKTDLLISHPVVKVHVVDSDKGTYLKKLDKNRPVTSFYESQNDEVDYILPVMTQPFDFKKQKSFVPVWEELLVFNECYNHFIQEDPKVILFFEVIDFLSPSLKGSQYRRLQQQGGWYRIAWAFLKIVGANRHLNTEKKLRLQLYVPSSLNITHRPRSVEVFHWWSKQSRIHYPATLYVTVKPLTPPETIEPALRSMVPLQEERGNTTFEGFTKSLNESEMSTPSASVSGHSSQRANVQAPTEWTRLRGQACKVPNCLMLSLQIASHRYFMLRFSCDGKRLAASCTSHNGHQLVIYEIPSGELQAQVPAHSGIIYDIDWSVTDKWLLTASGDCTVRVWNAETWTPLTLLPHPSFVYAAKFSPSVHHIVATGSYDHVIRVWSVSSFSDEVGHLLQELEGHKSIINTLSWGTSGRDLFSADGLGVVRLWCMSNDEASNEIYLKKEIKLEEIKGIPINNISLHPSGKKLLLHCRDSQLRLLDFHVEVIVQQYQGGLNFQHLLQGCLSPCGTFALSGTEDGRVCIWNTDTGNKMAVYSQLPYTGPVICVQYHPHDHMMAICALEDNMPILIYKYDYKESNLGQGLTQLVQSRSPTSIPLSSPQLSPTPVTPKMPEFVQIKPHRETILDYETAKEELDNRSAETSQDIQRSVTFDPEMEKTLKLHHVIKKLDSVMKVITQTKKSALTVTADSRDFNTSSVSWGTSFDSSTPQKKSILKTNVKGDATSINNSPVQKAVALYDYEPVQSDELKLKKGDRISVLDTKSDYWWVGKHSVSGKQGYFPANFVTVEEQGGYDKQTDLRESHETLTAVITESGSFAVISGPEEDKESAPPRRKNLSKRKLLPSGRLARNDKN